MAVFGIRPTGMVDTFGKAMLVEAIEGCGLDGEIPGEIDIQDDCETVGEADGEDGDEV
jgi:hypothetical protein